MPSSGIAGSYGSSIFRETILLSLTMYTMHACTYIHYIWYRYCIGMHICVCVYINLMIYHLFFSFFSFCFLGPQPWYMEVPRLRVKSELQLLAYTTAMRGLSHICNLHHHSSLPHQIPNPLNEARDRTHILMDPSQVR